MKPTVGRVSMTPIEGSSAMTAAGYDRASRTMHILFTGAKEPSVIENVDAATYQDFLAARSKGKFFHERIKP